MILPTIVPWGRSFAEYRDMFRMSEADMAGAILGCGDGPASFNAEFTSIGGRVVSVDPIYAFSGAEIGERVLAGREAIVAQAAQHQDRFVWKRFENIEALTSARMTALDLFLADYDQGKGGGRYIEGGLPNLPFSDRQFDLALSSHFLFLYSDHVDLSGHVTGLLELLRVADEVRVFPLLQLDGRRSPHVDPVRAALSERGWVTDELPVAYEHMRGGNSMLTIRKG